MQLLRPCNNGLGAEACSQTEAAQPPSLLMRQHLARCVTWSRADMPLPSKLTLQHHTKAEWSWSGCSPQPWPFTPDVLTSMLLHRLAWHLGGTLLTSCSDNRSTRLWTLPKPGWRAPGDLQAMAGNHEHFNGLVRHGTSLRSAMPTGSSCNQPCPHRWCRLDGPVLYSGSWCSWLGVFGSGVKHSGGHLR